MLSKMCPNCGTGNDPDFIRCYWCGSELPGPGPVPANRAGNPILWFGTGCLRHSLLYGEICGRLGEGDKGLLEEFDFTGEALAAFDADNAYIQGFADGMVFMGLFKKV